MTPEVSRRAVENLERFLNEEQLNTSLDLPNSNYKINLADHKEENIDLTRFKDPQPIDQKVKEANAKYEKHYDNSKEWKMNRD